MRRTERFSRRAAGVCSCCTLAGLLFLSPRVSRAFDDSDGWEDNGWMILQMQREAISSQEEQSREAGRARRRDELEQTQEKQSAERQAYFDSVLEASKAALRAPQGVYYRKPGYASTEAPPQARVVEADGIPFLYDQGIFWLQQGASYLVVAAPLGALVDALPAGAYQVARRPAALFYFFGTFFAEKGGRYEVVKPPAGVVVSYLPDGYREEREGGGTRYSFGPVSYRPVFVQGVLLYRVAEP
jgi:hypothetical protein